MVAPVCSVVCLFFLPLFVRYSLTELGVALAKRLESGERGGEDGQDEEEKKSEGEDSNDGPVTVDLTLDDEKEGGDSW